MAAPGQTVRVTIDDIAFGGDGVGRVNDFVVFVPFVAPGETVEAEWTEVKKRFGRARLRQVLQPSPERVTPACRYFGECGGCQYQHLTYAEECRLKENQVREAFARDPRLGIAGGVLALAALALLLAEAAARNVLDLRDDRPAGLRGAGEGMRGGD